METAYDDFIDFLASGPTTRQVADHHAPVEAQRRLENLIRKGTTTGIDDAERAEIETCLKIDHLMILARCKALRLLAEGEADAAPADAAERPAELLASA